MYTEENARGRFPLRDILLKAIIVIIFLILIIFIVTKVTNKDNSVSKNSSNYDKVFSANLDKMEDAAFKYYDKDKLPKEVGDKNELTLREMINQNLLEAFTDGNNEACDVNASYIRLTKNDDDYTLRVNLKCNEKEDYKLTRVGEYDYCTDTLCERDSSKEKENNKTDDKKEEVTDEVDITDATTTNNGGSSNNNTTTNSNQSAGSINNNNTNSNSNANNNTTNNVTVMYEYSKTNNPVFSGWSSWSSWKYNTTGLAAIKCNESDVNCLREVQLYSRLEAVGTDSNGKTVYGRVKYYSERTRSLISSGGTDTKWSTYNDTSLLNQGYTYTGRTR